LLTKSIDCTVAEEITTTFPEEHKIYGTRLGKESKERERKVERNVIIKPRRGF